MALTVEMQNTGDPGLQREVVATIEHVLADRPGNWRVSIVGSQANDKWEMKITGPNAFERSYTLEGTVGEHRLERIRTILALSVVIGVFLAAAVLGSIIATGLLILVGISIVVWSIRR